MELLIEHILNYLKDDIETWSFGAEDVEEEIKDEIANAIESFFNKFPNMNIHK